jgi:nucleoside-diphosphate-sugar epimerase
LPGSQKIARKVVFLAAAKVGGIIANNTQLINIGTGEDITIAEFARVVAAAVGYKGELRHLKARRHAAQIARCQSRRQSGLARPLFT